MNILKHLNARLRAVSGPITLPDRRMPDMATVERASARLFSTDDGRIVLDHLKQIVLLRPLSAEASEACLRHAEGQRALCLHLLRLVQAGRG